MESSEGVKHTTQDESRNYLIIQLDISGSDDQKYWINLRDASLYTNWVRIHVDHYNLAEASHDVFYATLVALVSECGYDISNIRLTQENILGLWSEYRPGVFVINSIMSDIIFNRKLHIRAVCW